MSQGAKQSRINQTILPKDKEPSHPSQTPEEVKKVSESKRDQNLSEEKETVKAAEETSKSPKPKQRSNNLESVSQGEEKKADKNFSSSGTKMSQTDNLHFKEDEKLTTPNSDEKPSNFKKKQEVSKHQSDSKANPTKNSKSGGKNDQRPLATIVEADLDLDKIERLFKPFEQHKILSNIFSVSKKDQSIVFIINGQEFQYTADHSTEHIFSDISSAITNCLDTFYYKYEVFLDKLYDSLKISLNKTDDLSTRFNFLITYLQDHFVFFEKKNQNSDDETVENDTGKIDQKKEHIIKLLAEDSEAKARTKEFDEFLAKLKEVPMLTFSSNSNFHFELLNCLEKCRRKINETITSPSEKQELEKRFTFIEQAIIPHAQQIYFEKVSYEPKNIYNLLYKEDIERLLKEGKDKDIIIVELRQKIQDLIKKVEELTKANKEPVISKEALSKLNIELESSKLKISELEIQKKQLESEKKLMSSNRSIGDDIESKISLMNSTLDSLRFQKIESNKHLEEKDCIIEKKTKQIEVLETKYLEVESKYSELKQIEDQKKLVSQQEELFHKRSNFKSSEVKQNRTPATPPLPEKPEVSAEDIKVFQNRIDELKKMIETYNQKIHTLETSKKAFEDLHNKSQSRLHAELERKSSEVRELQNQVLIFENSLADKVLVRPRRPRLEWMVIVALVAAHIIRYFVDFR